MSTEVTDPEIADELSPIGAELWRREHWQVRRLAVALCELDSDAAECLVLPPWADDEEINRFYQTWCDVRSLRRQRDGLSAWRPERIAEWARQFAEIVIDLARDLSREIEVYQNHYEQ